MNRNVVYAENDPARPYKAYVGMAVVAAIAILNEILKEADVLHIPYVWVVVLTCILTGLGVFAKGNPAR